MKQSLAFAIAALVLSCASCDRLILGPDSVQAPSPTVHASNFETVLDSLRYQLDFPALAGAIMTDTGIEEAGAVGSRRYGGPTNVSADDQFQIGSCGKVFTADLMGLLVDQGKLSWNTTLPEVFPEYVQTMRPEYGGVTVEDLLVHIAGFQEDLNVKTQGATLRDRRLQIVAAALQRPPVAKRGEVSYSNLGFLIAGAMAERVADDTYENLVTAMILQPLGLTTAGFGAVGTEGQEDQPLWHTPAHAPITATSDACLRPEYNPAGGLYLSVKDWAKYCQWVLACEAGHATLLSQETARFITTPVIPGPGGGYALAWGVESAEAIGERILTHSGSSGFSYAVMLLSTDRDYGVIAMTNQGSNLSSSADNLLWPVLTRLVDYHANGR